MHQSLIGQATELGLALALRYISPEPTLADAAAIISGRLHLWSGWSGLPTQDKLIITRFLRFRPEGLAQPKTFLNEADALLGDTHSPFTLQQEGKISYRTRYALKVPIDLQGCIVALLKAMTPQADLVRQTELPDAGDLVLTCPTEDGTRSFLIPEDFRPHLTRVEQKLDLHVTPRLEAIAWRRDELLAIADRLDLAADLHTSHRTSVENLIGGNAQIRANNSVFYRVNAPTGAGKSVLMRIMALASALNGHKVVLVVPNLVDIKNTIVVLNQSASVLGKPIMTASLHSMRRIAEQASIHFLERNPLHPYDYACLLDAFSSDGSVSKSGEEPCFSARVEMIRPKKEYPLRHCPLLFQCGKTTMLERALDADIVVVNHHALLSGTTRIPVEREASGTSTPLLEVLLKRGQIFLVDEVDGLLDAAINASVMELELGYGRTRTTLNNLHQSIINHEGPIPGMRNDHVHRAHWALTHSTVTVQQLLDLHDDKYFPWPKRISTWPTADDYKIKIQLAVDAEVLDKLYDSGATVPEHLRDLQRNLIHWAQSGGHVDFGRNALELTTLLNALQKQKLLSVGTNPLELEALKAALILRGGLKLIEAQLRHLQLDLPALIRANIKYADKVQQEIRGQEPISLTPHGPLQRTVYGFRRKEEKPGHSSLQIMAMRGDPHRTLLSLPEQIALAYSGVERTFIGFSATAYFPGASSFDLPAQNLIDVPDQPGKMTFENIPMTTAVSGAPMRLREERLKMLARELWPWIKARLAKLASQPNTEKRARLLLVTNSDKDAWGLAVALWNRPDGPGRSLGLVRSNHAADTHPFPAEQSLNYSELATFADGPHADKTLLISSLYPMSRGHNIVNADSTSALGGIVLCVRPMPSSDKPAANLAHICYETSCTVTASASPGEGLMAERKLANSILYAIRNSGLAFSFQPDNVKHYTVMNILVLLTQLLGRARRGGTAVTCYLADAAFFDGTTTWAHLLNSTLTRLEQDGHLRQFATHHAALYQAIVQYLSGSEKGCHES